jgi:PAS domain S-box-containing protein
MNNHVDTVKRLQAIFDAALDGIIIINDKGIILEVNQSTCSLFEYTMDELLHKNVNILMQAHDAKHHDQYIDNYHQSKIPKIIGIGREVIGKKKSGDLFPFWLAVIEVKLQDNIIFTGFVHDLSEIKNAEKDLKSLNEDLEKKVVERTYELENVVNQLLALNKQLEDEISIKMKIQQQLKDRELELENSLKKEKELGELKSRFVSMASHEFRTPLATITSSASLISRYTEHDQQANREKHINRVKSSVTHLTGILNDFLSMNKLEEGHINTNFETFDPSELCIEVVEELHSLLKKDQHIECKHEPDIGMIYTERKILKNTFINLISNAIKYTKDDGKIHCTLVVTNDQLEFTVKDNGIGIPEEDQKHMFERFFRASNVTNIEGTGLGLNIVKKYIEILHGDITFESKLYHGTTFKVVIPIHHQPQN